MASEPRQAALLRAVVRLREERRIWIFAAICGPRRLFSLQPRGFGQSVCLRRRQTCRKRIHGGRLDADAQPHDADAHHTRSSFRRFDERLRTLRKAASLNLVDLRARTDQALSKVDKRINTLRSTMQYEAAVQSALAEFQAEMRQIFGIAMESRDERILNAIGDVDDLRRAQMLGLLHPPWLQLDRDVASMRSALSRGLDATRHGRQYDLMQQTARDVEHSRKHAPPRPPSTALPPHNASSAQRRPHCAVAPLS